MLTLIPIPQALNPNHPYPCENLVPMQERVAMFVHRLPCQAQGSKAGG